MRMVRDGNQDAFVHLMKRHEKYVRWVISQFVPRHHDNEDLLQEVFLRVFRACKSYRPEAKLTTWLFTIARNVSLNSLRKKSSQCERTLPCSNRYKVRLEKISVVRDTDLPEQVAERAEVQSVVREAISQLSPRQQTAVRMAYLQGKSHRAIAGTMNTTPEAIKSLLRRTRCNLREALSPYTADTEAATT